MENANIVWRPQLPTSRVVAGTSLLHDSPPYLALSDTADTVERSRTAVFEAEVVENRKALLRDLPPDKIRVNPNVAELFGISTNDPNTSLSVSPINSLESTVPACRAATIVVEGVTPEALRRYLRREDGLLHPITETATIDGQEVRFRVTDSVPSMRDHATIRVTEQTDLEITQGSPEQRTESGRSRGDGSSGGSRSGGDGSETSDGDGDGDEEYPLDAKVPGHGFDAVAGFDDIKQRILSRIALAADEDLVDELTDKYNENFATRGNTMLLYGPPGCGKTFLAEAIAKEFKSRMEQATQKHVTYFDVKATRVLSKYKGESEERVERIFQQVREAASDGYSVIFFDEVETLVADRAADDVQSHQKSVTNQFLREMNEITDDVLLMGATNMPFSIDSAAARRFHSKIFVPHPGQEVMSEVWRKELEGVEGFDRIDFDELGRLSKNYTPAEISDRVVGSEIQSDVLQQYIRDDPVDLAADGYLQGKLQATSPRTVDEYVEKLKPHVLRNEMEGYDELESYIKEHLQDGE